MRLDHLLSKEKEGIERLPEFEIRKEKSERDSGRRCCSIFKDQGTQKWGCSSAGRAPALQAGGQGFDSLHLHHGEDGENEQGRVQERQMGS